MFRENQRSLGWREPPPTGFLNESWLEHSFLLTDLVNLEINESSCLLHTGGPGLSLPNLLIRKFSNDDCRLDTDGALPYGALREAIIDKGRQDVVSGPLPSSQCIKVFLCIIFTWVGLETRTVLETTNCFWKFPFCAFCLNWAILFDRKKMSSLWLH